VRGDCAGLFAGIFTPLQAQAPKGGEATQADGAPHPSSPRTPILARTPTLPHPVGY